MRILNTLSGQKEEFVPFGDPVKMYVCGVTPYDDSHFGHAMSYIFFDVIRRYIQHRGYKLKYVQNVTDIEDKIILRAKQRGISPAELAEKFTASYFADMDALNVMRPDITPRATHEVPAIIEVITGLIAKGHAYRTPDGSVYFRVSRDEDYGRLSHRTLDSMIAGARIEIGEQKEHPMDFALWKAAKPDEPAWDSPWGKGRPGWHIECTAMSIKYLGEQIDIHGGGQDLVFPHHENEIAQSESFTGNKPFVKYWLHNGFLQIGAEKMSKSLGNMLTIKAVLAKHSADAIRVFILSSHYRSPLSFSWESLEGAEKGVERLARAAHGEDASDAPGKVLDAEPHRKQFMDAMDDDFNTAQAMGCLFDLARAINQSADAGADVAQARATLQDLAGKVLGLKLPPITSTVKTATAKASTVLPGEAVDEIFADLRNEITGPNIDTLIAQRVVYRNMKNFKGADEIRTRLAELGILLEDTPGGTVWRKKKTLS